MKTKIFLGMLLVGVVPLRAQDYYVVTKENVDVYQYPAAGEVVGKVGTMNSFTVWEAGDGWMEFKTPIVSGDVPAKYLRKIFTCHVGRLYRQGTGSRVLFHGHVVRKGGICGIATY